MEGRAAAAAMERQADRLGQHAERADAPAHPGRRPGHGARPDPGGRAGRGRRVRRQDRRGPGRHHRRLGGQAHRPGAALGRDPQREHGRDDRTAAPSGRHQDRRQPGRPDPRLPPRRHPGLRRLPAHRRVPAVADLPDGGRRVRHPARAGRVPAWPSPTPRRSPPTGAPAGPRRPRPSSGRSTCSPPRSAWTRREVRRRNLVAPDKFPFQTRPAPSTTPASTRPRWTRCWPRPATPSCGPSRRAGARAATTGQLGIGVSGYVEITAPDPDAARRPGWW